MERLEKQRGRQTGTEKRKRRLAEDSWRLFRESTAIMEENEENLLERSEAEKKKKLEDEKQERFQLQDIKEGSLRRNSRKKLTRNKRRRKPMEMFQESWKRKEG
jgi:hypothetical protein